MRMWMLPPAMLCDKHLLGEHYECHMVLGSLSKGRRRSIEGLCEARMVEPQHLAVRHDALVAEMQERGFEHRSPMLQPFDAPVGRVSIEESVEALLDRCDLCAVRCKPKGK